MAILKLATKKRVKKKEVKKLTENQKRFVDILVLDPHRCATRAYIKAYNYKGKKTTAAVSAHENLTKPNVIAYLEKREKGIQKKLQERYEIIEDRILKEISTMAFTRMSDLLVWNADGITLLDSENLHEYVKAGVIEIKQTKTQYGMNISIKLDKRGALELLAKYAGLFKDKVEHDVADPLKKLMDSIAAQNDTGPTGTDAVALSQK